MNVKLKDSSQVRRINSFMSFHKEREKTLFKGDHIGSYCKAGYAIDFVAQFSKGIHKAHKETCLNAEYIESSNQGICLSM
ncbi:hypothetical protein CEXT_390221 [Caerostris extrusa]|uniref:Uncharacterized protein n=1 Tax=Caerostris extrusa TaxID=172846 RepID=A0AAV4QF96_CAEEX|nr:hypothetical protein CEXT_390221 [Caerostris extrusa]